MGKLSAGADRGIGALVAEAIAGMLAADLDLPVPEPFLVRLDPDFVSAISDPIVRDLAGRSSPMAFGSRSLPPGYTTWPVGKQVPKDALMLAAEIFAFDALISNPDRRPENPNCLFVGTSIAILDHELAFFGEGLIGWRPPWETGSLEHLRQPTSHLFCDQLRSKRIDMDRLTRAWAALTDARLGMYRGALPREWDEASGTADNAIELIAGVRDNLAKSMQEVMRVLQ